MEPESEKLADIVAPFAWKYMPIAKPEFLKALPAAAREREAKKAADIFASSGCKLFVHYTTPTLEERRKRLLSSALRKKNYPKTAAQLWQNLAMEEEFFWNEAARHLRQSMKQGTLSTEECLSQGGLADERNAYLWHAEIAVAAYLELPRPTEETRQEGEVDMDATKRKQEEMISKVELLEVSDCSGNKHLKPDPTAKDDEGTASTILLDTLPDPFSYEPKMLYSHFAHYDYNDIRSAIGKHQRAMLRQLADLFDKTGKVLFYYYAVPRLCKQTYPPALGETVTSQAADVWKLLPGVEKEKWCSASAGVKKRLGDGILAGLNVLELDRLDGEVLRLHELAAQALKAHE